MTDPCHDCPLCAAADIDLLAALCAVLGVTELPPPLPWDEGLEQRMSFCAETFDPETGRSRPLGPRKDRP